MKFTSKKLLELYHCATHLYLRNYETGQTTLTGQSCKLHNLCPLCAITRAGKYLRAYREKFKTLFKANKKLRCFYLVLTVKDGPDLAERFTHLEKALRQLIQRRRYAVCARNGKKAYNFALGSVFANVTAGAYSIEVKRGENSGEWHPHANVLLVSDKWIKVEDIINEWYLLTGDSFIVNIKQVKDREAGFCEIFKYALKFSDMTPADTWLAYTTLHKKRLFGSFGAFRGLEVVDDSVDLSDVPFIEEVYFYSARRYQLTNINHVGTPEQLLAAALNKV